MKLLIRDTLIEHGINTVSFGENNICMICYNTKVIDLVYILKSLNIEYKHISYSNDNGKGFFDRLISVEINDKCNIVMVGNDDVIKDKIYAFMYTSCVYESAYTPISLHKTKRGAFKAMNKFLNKSWYDAYDTYLLHDKGFDRKQRKKYPSLYNDVFKVDEHCGWFVREFDVE